MATRAASSVSTVTDPPLITALFNDTRFAWVWLIVRVYLGYQWITSGLGKIGSPAWMQDGSAIRGFWERAVMIPEPPGRPAIAFDWYRGFLQFLIDGNHHEWFARLITVGELLVGIALILGAFTGIAAFFGAFMNWNFMMAGSASTSPVLFTLAILLVIAWKVAGWWGLDRFLLPLLGTPWKPHLAFLRRTQAPKVRTT